MVGSAQVVLQEQNLAREVVGDCSSYQGAQEQRQLATSGELRHQRTTDVSGWVILAKPWMLGRLLAVAAELCRPGPHRV